MADATLVDVEKEGFDPFSSSIEAALKVKREAVPQKPESSEEEESSGEDDGE